jgi:hypothetical protein
MKIPVKIALERRPDEIARFKMLKHVVVDLPLEDSVYDWHDSVSVLYGLSIDAYVARRFGRGGFLFGLDDLLDIVDPAMFEGMTLARFYFAEALDSDANGRDLWGDGWFDPDAAYTALSWHTEVDAWLVDIEETEHAPRWHEAVDRSIEASVADPHERVELLRKLGEIVRELVEPWRMERSWLEEENEEARIVSRRTKEDGP